jgi:hypothetical protein
MLRILNLFSANNINLSVPPFFKPNFMKIKFTSNAMAFAIVLLLSVSGNVSAQAPAIKPAVRAAVPLPAKKVTPPVQAAPFSSAKAVTQSAKSVAVKPAVQNETKLTPRQLVKKYYSAPKPGEKIEPAMIVPQHLAASSPETGVAANKEAVTKEPSKIQAASAIQTINQPATNQAEPRAQMNPALPPQ